MMDFMQNKAMWLLDQLIYFLQKSAGRQGPLYGIMDDEIPTKLEITLAVHSSHCEIYMHHLLGIFDNLTEQKKKFYHKKLSYP